MKYWLNSGAVALALTLGCNSSPKINATQGGGSTGGGGGGANGGPSSDARTDVNLPDIAIGGGANPLGGNGGGASDGGGNGVDERTCGREDYMLVRVPPDLMLVLDRSSSMLGPVVNPANPAATRWTETIGALDEVVKGTAAGVNWGVQMFPQPSGCDVAAAPEVAIAANNYAPVMTSWAGGPAALTGPTGGTPTGLAMDRAVAYLKSLTTKNPKYIVLATDGEPSCSNKGLGSTPAAVMGVADAVAAGFKTYVIGIAITPQGTVVLNQLADAGGLPRTNPNVRYYPVANKADLVAALTAITGQVTNCVFPLTKPPPVPNNVKVTVSGTKVNSDAVNGWSYTAGNMAIQFNGTACEQAKNMPGDVQITFGCPDEIIP